MDEDWVGHRVHYLTANGVRMATIVGVYPDITGEEVIDGRNKPVRTEVVDLEVVLRPGDERDPGDGQRPVVYRSQVKAGTGAGCWKHLPA